MTTDIIAENTGVRILETHVMRTIATERMKERVITVVGMTAVVIATAMLEKGPDIIKKTVAAKVKTTKITITGIAEIMIMTMTVTLEEATMMIILWTRLHLKLLIKCQ